MNGSIEFEDMLVILRSHLRQLTIPPHDFLLMLNNFIIVIFTLSISQSLSSMV